MILGYYLIWQPEKEEGLEIVFHSITKILSRLQRKQRAKIYISLRIFPKDSNNMLYKHLCNS